MTAIVTGGTSGLGSAVVELLRSRGTRVVTVSRREAANVAGDAARRETAERAIAAAGEVDLLVNCAGVGIYGPAGSYDDDAIAQLLDANLVSTIVFCDALAPGMMRDGGTIVNVLSSAALIGKANETVYCAAKWGARGYTEALRAEANGTKLRVISIAPGGMDTPFWPEQRAGFMDPAEVAAAIVDAIFSPLYVSEIVVTRG